MFTDTQLDEIMRTLKAVAHDIRLKLLQTLLEQGEKSVSELDNLTGIGQPGLSQQLAVLRKAELVQTRREGKLVFYSLAPENLKNTATFISAIAGAAPGGTDVRTGSGRSPARGSAASFARML